MIYYGKLREKGLINMPEKTQGEELKEKLFNCKKVDGRIYQKKKGVEFFNIVTDTLIS